MRTILLQHRNRPRSPAPGAFAAEARVGIGLLTACGLAVGIAVLGLKAPGFGASERPVPGITLWAWLFAASGGMRILLPRLDGRWSGGPVLRLACAAIGLLSWSQMSWLVLQGIAMDRGITVDRSVAAGCLSVYAVVALRELHTIYRAAQDARSDHP